MKHISVDGIEVKISVDSDRVYFMTKHADGKDLPDEVWGVQWLYFNEIPGTPQEQINGITT